MEDTIQQNNIEQRPEAASEVAAPAQRGNFRPNPRGNFRGGPQRTGGFKPRDNFKRNEQDKFQSEFTTHLVSLRAVSKTRAGGRRRSFATLVICGNGKGMIGCGTGKSTDIVEAIKKAEKHARDNIIKVSLRGNTISHNVRSYHCGVRVIAKSVPEGTGLKTGGVTRKVFELAGIKDVSCKCIGNSMSPHNVIYALLDALEQTSSLKDISARLGKNIKDIVERSK